MLQIIIWSLAASSPYFCQVMSMVYSAITVECESCGFVTNACPDIPIALLRDIREVYIPIRQVKQLILEIQLRAHSIQQPNTHGMFSDPHAMMPAHAQWFLHLQSPFPLVMRSQSAMVLFMYSPSPTCKHHSISLCVVSWSDYSHNGKPCCGTHALYWLYVCQD